jgi:hypothetical protein
MSDLGEGRVGVNPTKPFQNSLLHFAIRAQIINEAAILQSPYRER